MTKFPIKYPTVTKGGYGKINRKRDPRHLKEIQAHSGEVGRVLFEWNQLHVELALLFSSILPNTSQAVLLAIWHSQGSDTGQRRMLVDAAHPRFWDDPVHYKRIRWIVQMADKMSAYRNIAAHVAMEIHDDTQTGGAYLLPDDLSAKRASMLRALLAKAPVNKDMFWIMLADDLYVLQQYARVVFFATAMHRGLPPFPRKPRLQSLPEIRDLERLVNETMKRPTWSRLRRSSRKKSAP